MDPCPRHHDNATSVAFRHFRGIKIDLAPPENIMRFHRAQSRIATISKQINEGGKDLHLDICAFAKFHDRVTPLMRAVRQSDHQFRDRRAIDFRDHIS